MKTFISKYCADVSVFFVGVYGALFAVGVSAFEGTHRGVYNAHPHTMWMESWDNGRALLPLVLLLFVLMVAVFFVLYMKRKSLH